MSDPVLEFLPLANRLLPAILAAGRLEMDYFRAGVAVERKGDDSPVTAADREAETLLLSALANAAPDIPVVAEEAAAAGRIPAVADQFFLVDALDGTKSFVTGNTDFTINVALIEHRRPTFGIVYAPASHRMFAALGPATAIEAAVDPDGGAMQFDDIGWRQIRTRLPNRDHITAVASRSHGTAETEGYLRRWNVQERRNIGSSLKFCLVACGEADVYPRLASIYEWDTAAGDAVLRAAGGVVTELDGSDMVYGKAVNAFKNNSFIAWGRRELAMQLT